MLSKHIYYKNTLFVQAIMLAFGTATIGAISQHAQAQTQTQDNTRQRVEITGSRIKRVDTETAAAVQIITRDDIVHSGATTLTEVLRSITAGNTGGYDTEGTPGAA
ncbi:MAG: Plug domain-containing protein, partial [Undibacterium sp.]|nr:Plug domain-containing protein [Undibacterium sp.]